MHKGIKLWYTYVLVSRHIFKTTFYTTALFEAEGTNEIIYSESYK